MLRWHRACAIVAGILLIYIAAAGTGIQLADLRALVFHAPETDPDMLTMRQHINGPDNFAVISAPDFTAPALPQGTDFVSGLARAGALGRSAVPNAPLRLVELRNAGGKVAGHVQMGTKHFLFDLGSGARMPDALLPPAPPEMSFSAPRQNFKKLHRFEFIPGGAAINCLGAVAMIVLTVTGLSYYARLYAARVKIGRRGIWWQGGDWWRMLHRWIATGASILIFWVAVTGLAVGLDDLGLTIHQWVYGRTPGFNTDQSSPLGDAELGPMTRTTLRAFHAIAPHVGIKVVRLRYFARFPQGVIVAADSGSSQYVFNAQTGRPMKMWEPGYPDVGFPAGWDVHEKLKLFHRGDIFGMAGRWLNLLAGLSLLYLSGSGLFIYIQLWRKRRKNGRRAMFWK